MIEQENQVSSVKKFGRDVFLYMPAKVVPALITVIMTPILTNLFNPEDYGNYILVTTSVSLFSIMPGMILGSSAFRFLPVYEQKSQLPVFFNTLIKTGILLISSMALSFFILIHLFRNFLSYDLYNLIFTGIFVFISDSLFVIFLYYLNAGQKASIYSFFKIFNTLLCLLLGLLIVIFFKTDISGFLLGAFLSDLISISLIYSTCRIKEKGTFSISIAIEMIKYGFPLVIGSFGSWAIKMSDRYIIALYRTSLEVGLYSAAYVVASNSIMLIWSLILQSSFPLIVNIWEKDGKEATEEFIKKTTFYYLLFAFPASTGLSILAKQIIQIFTGPDYYEGYKIIPIVTFGAFLLGLQWWAQAGLLLYKKTRLIMYGVIFGGILNIGLNFIFVPSCGYMAAAWTTLIGYTSVFIYMVIMSSRFLVWKFPFRSFLKIIFASAIMALVVYSAGNCLSASLWINLTCTIGAGIIVYFTLLFLLKEINIKDIKELLESKK
jgi:O-antigen/teichoic acid export membrane protein